MKAFFSQELELSRLKGPLGAIPDTYLANFSEQYRGSYLLYESIQVQNTKVVAFKLGHDDLFKICLIFNVKTKCYHTV